MATRWWGVAALATAFYSRCAAGLEEWPALPFASRAMLVKDPPDRDAFMPRAVPTTVFGLSTRVSGGMIVYQGNKLKEVANLQTSILDS